MFFLFLQLLTLLREDLRLHNRPPNVPPPQLHGIVGSGVALGLEHGDVLCEVARQVRLEY